MTEENDKFKKPTFGTISKDLVDKRNSRSSCGAFWKRIAKTTGTEYFTIQLQLTPERLKELLDKPLKYNKVDLNLVAFINKNKQENTKQPDFTIFEELND